MTEPKTAAGRALPKLTRVAKGGGGWHEKGPSCDGYQRHVHLRSTTHIVFVESDEKGTDQRWREETLRQVADARDEGYQAGYDAAYIEPALYLRLDSPEAERRLDAALATVGGVGRPQPNGAARAILAALLRDERGNK